MAEDFSFDDFGAFYNEHEVGGPFKRFVLFELKGDP
jgi:hypothetical protein